MFNGQGQMNATSLQDAIQCLAKYAAILSENVPANQGLAGQPSLSDQSRDDLMARAISSQEGKIALAQAMANPIRRNLDYHGIARRALVVDPLPQGAYPTYDRDIDVAAVVISSNGTGPESRVFGDRVVVPEFEIYANPTVRIAEVKRRQIQRYRQSGSEGSSRNHGSRRRKRLRGH